MVPICGTVKHKMKNTLFLHICLILLLPVCSWAACDPLLDSDGDGTFDCADECPTDTFKTTLDFCGCGRLEIDFNSDGVTECVDNCDFDPARADGGFCDCPLFEVIRQYIGTSSFCAAPPPLKRKTVITEPPGVIVIKDVSGVVSVKLIFEKFNGAVIPLSATSRSLFEKAALKIKNLKLRVTYQVVITPDDRAQQIAKRTSKKNELTVTGLKPGTYSVKYRAFGVNKSTGKTAFKTSFSPSTGFTVPQ